MQYVTVWKWMFVFTMCYALVWKWVFVCIMKEALVCIMIVCIYHACFLYWHELAETMYPDFVTCSNCLNCYWKWALALTLYNMIAWKCYPCTSFVAYLPSLLATFQPTHLFHWWSYLCFQPCPIIDIAVPWWMGLVHGSLWTRHPQPIIKQLAGT